MRHNQSVLHRTTPDWESLCGPWQGEKPGAGFEVLSLYSGAGGLDRGFIDAGFLIKHAIEVDRHAVATYQANLGDHVLHDELPGALQRLPPPGRNSDYKPDVIIGGPPCQGFSVIGRMDPADPRSRHVHAFLDAVRAYRPAAFCMENVKALATSPRWAAVYRGLVNRARDLGYNVEHVVLDAADFTVPQSRQRMFLIGVRDGHPVFPVGPTRARPLTVLEALRTLPAYKHKGNDTLCTAKVVLAKKPVLRPSPYQGSLLFNGSGRPLRLDAVARTLPASMGGNGTPIVDQRELEARLLTLRTPGRGASSGARDAWVVAHHRRLVNGEPEPAASHPLRRITVEEASALQGFPSDWKWKGPTGARFHQIGNAVPPRLARYVALAMGHALSAREGWVDLDQEASLPRRRPRARPRSVAPSRRQLSAT
jgi:DNA (cytosine-5)-methyltransferase 1